MIGGTNPKIAEIMDDLGNLFFSFQFLLELSKTHLAYCIPGLTVDSEISGKPFFESGML